MPSTTETSADDDDEEDAGLWLFSQAGQKEPDEDVQVERLTERHVQDVQLQMGRFWDNDYEAADRVCLLRSRSTASEGLKKLHEVAAYPPDYDFKLKLVLKCHLTLIDYEDRTMGSAEA